MRRGSAAAAARGAHAAAARAYSRRVAPYPSARSSTDVTGKSAAACTTTRGWSADHRAGHDDEVGGATTMTYDSTGPRRPCLR